MTIRDFSVASALSLALGAVHASAAIIRFDNSADTFQWRASVDGNSSMATWLDVTRPATQSGVASPDAFGLSRFTGQSTPHFNEDRIVGVSSEARLARRPTLVTLEDEEGILNAFGFARSFSPGAVIGSGLTYQQSAHIAVTNYYTSPHVSRILPRGVLGVSVVLDDGVHYGWIELAPILNPAGFYLGYDLLGWGYETVANTPLIVPAPATTGLLALSILAARRRRHAG